MFVIWFLSCGLCCCVVLICVSLGDGVETCCVCVDVGVGVGVCVVRCCVMM